MLCADRYQKPVWISKGKLADINILVCTPATSVVQKLTASIQSRCTVVKVMWIVGRFTVVNVRRRINSQITLLMWEQFQSLSLLISANTTHFVRVWGLRAWGRGTPPSVSFICIQGQYFSLVCGEHLYLTSYLFVFQHSVSLRLSRTFLESCSDTCRNHKSAVFSQCEAPSEPVVRFIELDVATALQASIREVLVSNILLVTYYLYQGVLLIFLSPSKQILRHCLWLITLNSFQTLPNSSMALSFDAV